MAWERARRADSIDAYVRKILVRASIDDSRRPWRRRELMCAASMPDTGSPPSTSTVKTQSARGLQRLREALAASTESNGARCVLTTLAVTTQTGLSGPSGPSPAFGDPGSRMSLVGDGGSDLGYPDLVVERGDKWVTIRGFGWPIEGMDPVSGSAGTVALPEVSKLDAESMCLSMLIQAAPEVPNDSWEHSGGWIDGFPTRSGLITSYAAQYDGRTYGASCTIPGDFNPKVRPDLSSVPMPKDTEAIMIKCSYQAHVDFRAWRVTAASRSDKTLSAALVSQDDHLARCVLSSDPAQRVTQVSQSLVTQTAAGEPVLYGGVDTNTLTIVGSVPASVTSVLVTTADQTTTAAVRDQTYAIALAYPEGAPRRPRSRASTQPVSKSLRRTQPRTSSCPSHASTLSTPTTTAVETVDRADS